MPSTQQASTTDVRALVAAVALLVLAGCEGPQVTIALSKSPDLLVAPNFVRFAFFLEDEEEPLEAGPFGAGAIPASNFAAIPPGVSFSVDVIGCASIERDACEDETSFVGRGCEGPFTLQRGEQQTIDVELQPNAVGNAACPIDPAGEPSEE